MEQLLDDHEDHTNQHKINQTVHNDKEHHLLNLKKSQCKVKQ